MRLFSFLMTTIIVLFAIVATPSAEKDELYQKCKTDPRGPWCYQEAVEQINNPERCENILTHWPKANGVHGWCYYQLAMKNKDCALCSHIHKADIKKMCERDVCKR